MSLSIRGYNKSKEQTRLPADTNLIQCSDFEDQFTEIGPQKEIQLDSHQRDQLVDANGLLKAFFNEECRPSLRWVRQMQAQRKIPYVKIGHLVRFDPEAVRRALNENCTVHARGTGTSHSRREMK